MSVWEQVRTGSSVEIDDVDVRVTERQGHAREIAASAEGYDVLAAVGGDGTVSEVLSGVLDRPDRNQKVAIIPAGTGNDIARNLGIHSPDEGIDAMQGGRVRVVDLIRVEATHEGRLVHRYAFLSSSVGFCSIRHLRPWMKRLLGATGAYYLAAFIEIAAYRPPEMKVVSGREQHSGAFSIVVIGNVEYTSGGSMRLAPGARFDDGELDVSIIPYRSRLTMLTTLPKVASGRHIDESDVRYFGATNVRIESDTPLFIEVDGDLFGTTPASFAVCPKVASILGPP